MDDRTFEIGLVGAGAISAGAYTGGVVDFMVYALDCWYAEKKINPNETPPHDVKISVFSGASAGAISALLATGYFSSNQPSIPDETAAKENKGLNKLFDSWVERIDISSLLQSKDLADKDAAVISLLDSAVLNDIANSGLTVTPRPEKREYIADDFHLYMTVTNLRGVPYAFRLNALEPATFDMSMHADYVHFKVTVNDIPIGDNYSIPWSGFGVESEIKTFMKTAALASGAFPVGLAPRVLKHRINLGNDIYTERPWPTPNNGDGNTLLSPKPAWQGMTSDFDYVFQNVDGGVMNNEPLELARQTLSGGAGIHNPQDGLVATKAVLMIDPFPSEPMFKHDYKPKTELFWLILDLFDALKNQARFKPEELALAMKDSIYSRFMIAPSRNGEKYPIACGSLGGFGGFLKREFRAHDYFLGRRNAQKFFKEHFVLPEFNPLFDNWDQDLKDRFYVKDQDGNHILDENGLKILPIIPLVGAAFPECKEFKWPNFNNNDLATLRSRLESRVDVVLDRLVNQYFKKKWSLTRTIARIVIGRKKGDIVDSTMEKVLKNLKEMKLM